MSTEKTIFLTGFPGFIASRLLQRLAREDARFLLLVQPAFAERARQELRRIAEQAGRSVPEFTLLPGDITLPNLGMSASDLEMARSKSTILFHLAAIYDLAVTREVGLLVNVQGTRNVNAFARSLSDLRHYHYVSTCYVAGKRTGRILENELRHEAGFRNHYEESKYLAELNVVPVDFVVESMARLAQDPLSIGKTIQLADPAPLTTRDLFNEIARCLVGRESRLTIPAWLVEFSLMLPLAPKITGLPHSAVPYFFLKQNYDTTQAGELLNPHGVGLPPCRLFRSRGLTERRLRRRAQRRRDSKVPKEQPFSNFVMNSWTLVTDTKTLASSCFGRIVWQ